MRHYHLESTSRAPNSPPLVFDWDRATGLVQGPGAEYILARAKPRKSVPLHPMFQGYRLGHNPPKKPQGHGRHCRLRLCPA